MNKEEIKQHFAEICECIWSKMLSKQELPPSMAKAIRQQVTVLVMGVWNISLLHTSFTELKKELQRFAKAALKENAQLSAVLMDAAELKWQDYRDDKELIATAEVKSRNGKPYAMAYFKGERPALEEPINAFRNFMQSPENQKRLHDSSPGKEEDTVVQIANEYSDTLIPHDSDTDDTEEDGYHGLFQFPISYEELDNLYMHTKKNIELESKHEILNEILEYQPFLAPLCKDAKACFDRSEKIYEQEQKTGKPGKYTGSLPELILTIAAAYMEDTDLIPYDEKYYKAYLKEAKGLVNVLLENNDEFFREIRFYAEHYLLWFITEKIRELKLPAKEFKKQLSVLLAWGLIVSETRQNQHPDEYENMDDEEEAEEEYDFDEKNLRVLQLHVKLRGFRCSADVLVREDSTFEDLHDFLNPLFNRDDDHLYRFECDDGCTAVRDEEDIEGDEVLSSDSYIGHHLSTDSAAYYLFDYGDEWEHDITVKKILPLDSKVKYPKVLKITGEIPEQYPDWDEDGEE